MALRYADRVKLLYGQIDANRIAWCRLSFQGTNMTIGLEQVPNDAARLRSERPDSPASPASDGEHAAFTELQPRALRISGLLLTLMLIGILGTALTSHGQPVHNQGAKAKPLLLMMTDKPSRHAAP